MRPLIQLLNDNKHMPRQFEAVQNSAEESTVYIYDVIVSSDQQAMWGGIAPESFAKTLNELKTPVINLRINSPGGDVFAGRAMETTIKDHPSKIVAYIDGYAASISSILAIAADEVQISDGSFIMIHHAWSFVGGNKGDLRKMADLLEKIDSTLVDTYVKKTGATADQVMSWLDAETWFTAKEAVSAGFAGKISEYKPKNLTNWNVSAYGKAPKIDEKPAGNVVNDEEIRCLMDQMKMRLMLASIL